MRNRWGSGCDFVRQSACFLAAFTLSYIGFSSSRSVVVFSVFWVGYVPFFSGCLTEFVHQCHVIHRRVCQHNYVQLDRLIPTSHLPWLDLPLVTLRMIVVCNMVSSCLRAFDLDIYDTYLGLSINGGTP